MSRDAGGPWRARIFHPCKSQKSRTLAASVRGDSSRVARPTSDVEPDWWSKSCAYPTPISPVLTLPEPLLENARENLPRCRFTHFDGQSIDDEDNSYHFVFAINVFHHIAIKNRMQLLMEMWRVFRPRRAPRLIRA